MRIAGILQPGTVLNYVLEAKHVKAGLIVVQTIEERDKVWNENKNSLVNGTPIYVAGTHKTYRYNEEQDTFIPDLSFKEDENGVLCIEGEDGSLKKIKVEVGLDDLDPSLKEEIENLPTIESIESLISNKLQDYVTLSSLEKTLSEINSKLAEKQDKLVAGEGIQIEGNVISSIYKNVDQIIFATKASFPYIGEEDKLYVAKEEHKLYLWDASTEDYLLVSGQEELDINVINGGTAISNL